MASPKNKSAPGCNYAKSQESSNNWIITAVITMFQLATCYFTVTDAVISFSFLKQPCLKIYPIVMEIVLLHFSQIIVLDQAKKKQTERVKLS